MIQAKCVGEASGSSQTSVAPPIKPVCRGAQIADFQD